MRAMHWVKYISGVSCMFFVYFSSNSNDLGQAHILQNDEICIRINSTLIVELLWRIPMLYRQNLNLYYAIRCQSKPELLLTAQQRLHLERYARVQRNDACILIWDDMRERPVAMDNFITLCLSTTFCCMQNLLRPVFEYIRRFYLFTNNTLPKYTYFFVSLFNPSKNKNVSM